MYYNARPWRFAVVIVLCAAADSAAQQAVPQVGVQQQLVQQAPAPGVQQQQQQPVQPPVEPQVPDGFQLNQLQQAALDTVLTSWQAQSAKITTFQCKFERWEYESVFGPGPGIPLYKNKGEITYNKPDKGSFQISETNKWQAQPAAPGQPANAPQAGNWVLQPDAIGAHWVCDGTSVYEYRHELKQLVEHPIPPQLQGQAIVDGPLPFLFGADAAKMKERYWMKLDQQQNQDPTQVWIIALPKHQAQAADATEIDVILDAKMLLPLYMQVWKPNRDHDTYIFDTKNASINSPLARIQALFQRPSVPFGWKRVVEQVPLQQAAQPAPAAR